MEGNDFLSIQQLNHVAVKLNTTYFLPRSSSPSFALSNLKKHRSLSLRRRTFRYVYVMEAAKGHQLRVPEDIAVVGFDGIPAAKVDCAVTNDRATTHCGEGHLAGSGRRCSRKRAASA